MVVDAIYGSVHKKRFLNTKSGARKLPGQWYIYRHTNSNHNDILLQQRIAHIFIHQVFKILAKLTIISDFIFIGNEIERCGMALVVDIRLNKFD